MTEDKFIEISLFNVAQVNFVPVIAQQIGSCRLNEFDLFLSKVLQYTTQGWPSAVPEQPKTYKQRANKIICVIVGHYLSSHS